MLKKIVVVIGGLFFAAGLVGTLVDLWTAPESLEVMQKVALSSAICGYALIAAVGVKVIVSGK